jgi:predicted HAD superfamily Cof-like phosphohydrolase
MSDFDDVGEFHEKFGLPNVTHDGAGPREVPEGLLEFRRAFMQEELDEFVEGMDEGDHAKMFDALIDLVYVAMGTAHLQGYPWSEGWDLVQAANMQKVLGKKPGRESQEGWDVTKPPGWTAPDIEGLLRNRRWDVR